MLQAAGLQPRFEPLLPSEHTRDRTGFRQDDWAPVEMWVAAFGSSPGGRDDDEVAEREADAVAADIRRLHDDCGVDWREFGILLRSGSRVETFESALRAAARAVHGLARPPVLPPPRDHRRGGAGARHRRPGRPPRPARLPALGRRRGAGRRAHPAVGARLPTTGHRARAADRRPSAAGARDAGRGRRPATARLARPAPHRRLAAERPRRSRGWCTCGAFAEEPADRFVEDTAPADHDRAHRGGALSGSVPGRQSGSLLPPHRAGPGRARRRRPGGAAGVAPQPAGGGRARRAAAAGSNRKRRPGAHRAQRQGTRVRPRLPGRNPRRDRRVGEPRPRSGRALGLARPDSSTPCSAAHRRTSTGSARSAAGWSRPSGCGRSTSPSPGRASVWWWWAAGRPGPRHGAPESADSFADLLCSRTDFPNDLESLRAEAIDGRVDRGGACWVFLEPGASGTLRPRAATGSVRPPSPVMRAPCGSCATRPTSRMDLPLGRAASQEAAARLAHPGSDRRPARPAAAATWPWRLASPSIGCSRPGTWTPSSAPNWSAPAPAWPRIWRPRCQPPCCRREGSAPTS